MADLFDLLDSDLPTDERRRLFEAQRVPVTLGNHAEGARHYRPDRALVLAANAALVVGAPLLITGEPGTGKTQVAHWLALSLGIQERLFSLEVRSTTTAEDLIYRFDMVAYFHAAHDPARVGKPLSREDFIEKGPLWRALMSARSIVLIDEIDKAPRDFPNDLLHVLDQHEFEVKELGQKITRQKGAAPPLVVITSNSERRLPEPFLRRCIFHHIELTEDLVRRAVEARVEDFPRLGPEVRAAAIRRFLELRARSLRKKPATAELLVWLVLLSASKVDAKELDDVPLRALPALSALVKDRDDLAELG
jgi:MoxR-like ATPase